MELENGIIQGSVNAKAGQAGSNAAHDHFLVLPARDNEPADQCLVTRKHAHARRYVPQLRRNARAIKAATVDGGIFTTGLNNSAPNEHLAAGPECRVVASGLWRRTKTGRGPNILIWPVSATCVQRPTVIASPDYHFISRPDSSVAVSNSRSVHHACRSPTIRDGVVPAACINGIMAVALTTPHNHFVACPNSAVVVSDGRRVGQGSCSPSIAARIVSSAGIHQAKAIAHAAPDNHFGPSPNNRMPKPAG